MQTTRQTVRFEKYARAYCRDFDPPVVTMLRSEGRRVLVETGNTVHARYPMPWHRRGEVWVDIAKLEPIRGVTPLAGEPAREVDRIARLPGTRWRR